MRTSQSRRESGAGQDVGSLARRYSKQQATNGRALLSLLELWVSQACPHSARLARVGLAPSPIFFRICT